MCVWKLPFTHGVCREDCMTNEHGHVLRNFDATSTAQILPHYSYYLATINVLPVVAGCPTPHNLR